jgi:hypothetical protein
MYLVRFLILICILIVWPAPVSAESTITGWGKAKWGMSHSAVKKHFDLNPWEPGSTPTCKLKKKIRIWGRDFGVGFYFDERSSDGKLFKVVLVHINSQAADPGDTAWLNSIKDMLVEKYGNPGSFTVKEKMKISHWINSEGQLKLTTVTGRTLMCALEYMAVSTEGKKL